MTTATLEPEVALGTIADLVERLGGIPLQRIRLFPSPGTATEQDLIAYQEKTNRCCELVDGTIVEKPLGSYESRIAAVLIYFFEVYFDNNPIAAVMAPDGMVRTQDGQVREPDVSLYLRTRFPNGVFPRINVLELTPDLVVEVLSQSNTIAEMQRKRREYFAGQTRIVWEVHPRQRVVRVYSSVADFVERDESQTLDGGDVLPGFTLAVAHLFARAD